MPHCHIVTSTTHRPCVGRVVVSSWWADMDNRGLDHAEGVVRKLSSLLDSAVFPGVGRTARARHRRRGGRVRRGLEPGYKAHPEQVVRIPRRWPRPSLTAVTIPISGGTDNHLC